MIAAFICGLIVGAVGFSLILWNNSKLATKYYKVANKIEKVIEEKTGKDI